MKISLDKLQESLILVLQSLREFAPSGEIEIESDFYRWYKSNKFFDVYDFSDEDVTIGQLSEDVARMLAVSEGQDPPSLVALASLSAILLGIQSELLWPAKPVAPNPSNA